MGYYTSYKLTIEEGSLDDIQKIEEEMELIDAGLGAGLAGVRAWRCELPRRCHRIVCRLDRIVC